MQSIEVHEAQFGCGICGKKYPIRGKAKKCFEVHVKAINKLLVGYKPGAHIMAHYLKDYDASMVPVTIIKTEGELLDFKVLVEHEDGSRWWEKIVAFQSGDSVKESIQNKPTNFWSYNSLVS